DWPKARSRIEVFTTPNTCPDCEGDARWVRKSRSSFAWDAKRVRVLMPVASVPSFWRYAYTTYRSPALNRYPQSPPPFPVRTATVAFSTPRNARSTENVTTTCGNVDVCVAPIGVTLVAVPRNTASTLKAFWHAGPGDGYVHASA